MNETSTHTDIVIELTLILVHNTIVSIEFNWCWQNLEFAILMFSVISMHACLKYKLAVIFNLVSMVTLTKSPKVLTVWYIYIMDDNVSVSNRFKGLSATKIK